MAARLFFEDIEVGSAIPALVKRPSTQTLVMWAGASGDYYPLHYDKDFAQKMGAQIIVHGRLKAAYLTQMLRDWMGEEGTIKKIAMQHRGMDFPGETITCAGVVTKKYDQGSEHYAECDVWTQNPKGDRNVRGTATVLLPSKGNH